MQGEVQLQAVVQIGDDILGWFWGVWHIRAKGSQGLEKLWTHLKAWAAAATPMSVPSSSFGRRQSAASFLSSFLGGNFPDEMRTSEKSRSKLVDYLKHQNKVNLPLPVLSWSKRWICNGWKRKYLEESCPIFCSSFNCEGGMIFFWRLLGHKLLKRRKSMPGLFVWHVFPQSPPVCLFYGVFVPSYRVRWPYQTEWESETEIRWDFLRREL